MNIKHMAIILRNRLLAQLFTGLLALVALLPLAHAVPPVITAANPVVIDFDTLGCQELVLNYYAGGTGSLGSGPGPDYGVTFLAPGDTQVINDTENFPALCPFSSYGKNMPSGTNAAERVRVVNVAGGFRDGFALYYIKFNAQTVGIWSGLNGTGSLLATFNLDYAPNSDCPYPKCDWTPAGTSFAGTALSVVITNNVLFEGGAMAYDSLTFGAANPTNSAKASGNPLTQPGGCACGDPINLGTGSVFEQTLDYSTVGSNQLAFVRSYNSLTNEATLATMLGRNWRSNYDRYLRIKTATTMTNERPDGRQVDFRLIAGKWTPDSDIDATLTQAGNTWTFTDGGETTETYVQVPNTPVASLTTIKKRNGYTQTLSYDASFNLLQVVDSYNRKLLMTYSTGGTAPFAQLLNTLTTPDGLVLTYTFQNARLNQVLYSTSPNTGIAYFYESAARPNALTRIANEIGQNTSRWTYDAKGRALSNERGGVGTLGSNIDKMTVAYNDTDGSRTVTNALGQPEIYRFAKLQGVAKLVRVDRVANGSVAAATRLFTFDANGFAASQTDWKGKLTTFVNNARGQPLSITRAPGTPLARTATMTYDSTFAHLPKTLVAPGITVSFTYDANGNMLTRTATDTTTRSVPYSTNGVSKTTTLTWGANFLLASVKGPRTDVNALTSMSYDASGALTQITNALNQTTTVTQHLPGGLPQTVVDPNGVTRQFTYDARQRLLTSTVVITTGAAIDLTSTYAYDAAGNVVSVRLPDGSTITNTYDTANRLTGHTDLFGQKIAYTLNAAGGVTQSTVKNGASTTVFQVTRTLDSLNRVLQNIGGVGQNTSVTYDANGNALAVADPLVRITQAAYDALDRPVQGTDPAGGVTALAYDAQDRLATVTDPNAKTTAYIYDGFGRLISEVSPASGTKVYRYDVSGNLTQRVDARGAIANFTYDSLDRRLTTTYPGNSAENVSFTYDRNFSFGIGQLATVLDAAGTLNRYYDQRGNIVVETRQSTTTNSTQYAYDDAGRIDSITYPSGWLISYVRDPMGRNTAITATPPGGNTFSVVSAMTYLPFGPMRSLTYGNGLTETRTYDLDYRLTSIAVNDPGPRLSLTYGYDAANNVKAVTDGTDSAKTQATAYDALDRLVSASGGYGALTYSYDKLGNRLTETPPTPSAAPAFDGLGAITGFTYNQAGRLASSVAGAQTVAQYTYNAFGQRAVKTQPGSATTTRYVYGPGGRLLEESSSQGTTASADYIYLDDGRPVASFVPTAVGAMYFLHVDRRDAPQLMTDFGLSSRWQRDYQPFGQIGSNNAGPPVQNLRLPGQIADAETGLYHNGARDYVPNLGRYLQSDPIGLAGGLNTYAYVGANPMTFVDPSGTSAIAGSDLLGGSGDVDETTAAQRKQNSIVACFTPERRDLVNELLSEGEAGKKLAQFLIDSWTPATDEQKARGAVLRQQFAAQEVVRKAEEEEAAADREHYAQVEAENKWRVEYHRRDRRDVIGDLQRGFHRLMGGR